MRAAASRFETVELPCIARLEQLTTSALNIRQPQAQPAVHRAAMLLAALRLGDDAGRSEGAIRQRLGVDDSPMLDATVDQVVNDAELKLCAGRLQGPAATLTELADRCLAQLGETLAFTEPAPETSSGSAR